MLASEEVGDIFRDGKAYDVHVWSTPATRNSLSDVRELPIDTPDGGHVRLRRRGRRAPRPDARTPSIARTSRGRIDVGANVRGPRPRLGRPGARSSVSSRVELPARGTTPRCSASTRSARRPSTACSCSRAVAVIGIFLILLASFGSLRLAMLAFVTLPMALVGRRARRVLHRRRHHLARFAGRVLHRPRDRGAQRHHADQPLPAPRGPRGR